MECVYSVYVAKKVRRRGEERYKKNPRIRVEKEYKKRGNNIYDFS